ncbi:MAG: hypothetical protein GXC94_02060 [Comamonadaceae bacterium]|nr:hypothetical protein [Comamonadaceae bacterium]
MTYGFHLENPSGFLTVSTEVPTPYFVGKASPVQTLPTNAYDTSTMRRSGWVLSTPAPPDCVVAITLPDVGADVSYAPPAVTASGGGSSITITAYHRNTVAPSRPEVYVFRYGTVPPSGASYGMCLYTASGALSFDAGHRHLMPFAVYARPPLFGSIGIAALSKPCFILPTVGEEHREYFDRPSGQSDWERETGIDFARREGAYCRRGTTLRLDYITYEVFTSYGAGPFGADPYSWGNASNGGICMLDASIYD